MINKPMDPNFFNIDLLILNRSNTGYMLEVKSPIIFESSSNIFKKDGLFSNEIFGDVGSKDRMERCGYIDLKIPVMHPLIYKTVCELSSLYKNIINSKVKAKFDNKIKDFVIDPNGDTGINFFLENFTKINFDNRNSDRRDFKIKLIQKYSSKDSLLTRWLVIPAGLRDYTIADNGRPTEDEINTLYRKLLTSTNMIRNTTIRDDDMHTLDNIRLKIQNTLLEIYKYFETLLNGKNKFIQGKWAKRAVANGTRNVLSPSLVNIKNLKNENKITINHTIIGLYQYLKGIEPIAVNRIQTIFINSILNHNSTTALLINPTNMKSEIVNISVAKRDEWLSPEGLGNIITKMIQDELFTSEVHIDKYYLMLVYEKGNDVYLIKDTNNIPEDIDKSKLRPITYIELFYIAIAGVIDKFPCVFTRYPISGLGSIFPSKAYVKTTTVGKEVTVHYDGQTRVVPEYPRLEKPIYKTSASSLCRRARLGADFDGDTVSVNFLFTDEAIKEIDNKLESVSFYLDPSGNISDSVQNDINELTFLHMSDDPDEKHSVALESLPQQDTIVDINTGETTDIRVEPRDMDKYVKDSKNPIEVVATTVNEEELLEKTLSNVTFSTPEYYILSAKSDMDDCVLRPDIPVNFFTMKGYENNYTKRVAVYPDIKSAIRAMSGSLSNQYYYLYKAEINNLEWRKPDIEELPYVGITNELWVLEPVKLKLVEKIKILQKDNDNPLHFTYGAGIRAELYDWAYEVVNKD